MATEEDLDRAAAILRHGGLVGLPTETVYGLAANALDPEAVRHIYEVKGRPANSPLIVHVASIDMARSLVRGWPIDANVLAGAYWPGPLTLVLPKRAVVPDIVTAGLDTVGLRMPSHPIALEVIRRAGIPLAAPSANKFTQLSPTTAQHAREALAGTDVFVLDGGTCAVGIESTVISLAGEAPVLLRPGMISQEAMEQLLEKEIAVAGQFEGSHPSPGMHERHYSPRTPVVLITGGQLPAGRGAWLWMQREAAAELTIQMPSEPAAYAQRLYHALHEADAARLDWIAVERPPDDPQWSAIADRLQRAAHR